jgi:hypothetical protein
MKLKLDALFTYFLRGLVIGIIGLVVVGIAMFLFGILTVVLPLLALIVGLVLIPVFLTWNGWLATFVVKKIK